MGHIQRTVYAVVELYDYFTGKPVTDGSCHVVSEIKTNVIAKENGAFVFLEAPEMDSIRITFYSDIYYSESVKLAAFAQKNNYRHKILWMMPCEKYPFPLKAAIIRGRLPIGRKKTRYHMVLGREEHQLYLGRDYEAGENEIFIHGFLNEQPEGIEVIFYADQKPSSEIFELAGKADETGAYVLRQPLKNSYKKGEAVLHRAYLVYQKEDGSFLAAFPGLRDKKEKCDLLKNGKILETLEIEVGQNERKE